MWYEIPRDEQETVINIDYYERTISLYTTRKAVANKLLKKLGQPTRVDTIEGKTASVEYRRNLSDPDIRSLLTISTIIGSFRNKRD